MTTKTLKSEWLSFANNSLKSCPEMQVREMQKAFYVGVTSSLNMIMSIPDGASEEEHYKIFESVFREAELFLDNL